MIQNRFFRNVSYNTFQLVINQIFGLAIFYGLSKGLDKIIFGQINWSLAVLLTLFGVLSFGIDQVMVKKIAAGYNRQSVFTAYLFHVIFSGGFFYFILLLIYFIFPNNISEQTFLLFIGLGKLCIFLSTPFKQLAAGLEKFQELFLMSITSNIIRGLAVVILLLLHKMTVSGVLIIFILGDLSELILCVIIARPLLKSQFKVRWNKRRQILLLKESLPQTGVVLFTSIMSRFDWILIGIIISSSKLAEYSFAYKIFEVSTLPLLVIAPIMIPLFTRLHKSSENINNIFFFLEWQIMIASFIALLLNVCWIPVIDFISDGKYGKVNAETIFLLSLSMPLLYFTNYLWTINFAKGNLKDIFFVMGVSFTINIIACSVLIPTLKNGGAAIAFFITAFSQLIIYMQKKSMTFPKNRGYFLLLWPFAAIFSGLISYSYSAQPFSRISIAVCVYFTIVFGSKQVRPNNWKTLQSLYQ
jgi:O-antigen/teichoic acid export membrane protein